MEHTLRTRFKKEIVSEFVPPLKRSNKAIILCGGAPGYPGGKRLMFSLAGKGYWTFFPRYRGTWESDGLFLKKSLHLDILDVIDSLPRGFKDLWSGKKYKIKDPKIYLIGSSFGGPAAILASNNKRVKKVVAVAPVTDWRVETELEPLNWLAEFTRAAFGNGYRFRQRDWDKLKGGMFYNPISVVKSLDRKKICIIHAKDDKVVSAETSIVFARELGCKLVLLRKGGHISLSELGKAAFWRKVDDFLN